MAWFYYKDIAVVCSAYVFMWQPSYINSKKPLSYSFLSSSFSVNLELIYDLWVPNIFIYNLKTFKVIYVLSKLAGLWINSKKEIYYR